MQTPSRPKPSAVVFAKDVARLAAFYADVAALVEVHRDRDHIVLDDPQFQLVLHGIPAKIAAGIVITHPPEVRENTPIKLCLPVQSIALARQVAAGAGGQIAATSREWTARGFRACDGWDPEGNVFQVRELAD